MLPLYLPTLPSSFRVGSQSFWEPRPRFATSRLLDSWQSGSQGGFPIYWAFPWVIFFTKFMNQYILVGGLEHEFYDFPYIGNNNPN